MKLLSILTLLVLSQNEAFAQSCKTHYDSDTLVWVNGCGRLSYGRYANRGAREADSRIPDFSYAGYMQQAEAIPWISTEVGLGPSSDGGDDRQRIQNAIDRVSLRQADANGHRGAVRLGKGVFRVNGTLYIRTSGVVLRGAGHSTEGTVIISTGRDIDELISVSGPGNGLPRLSTPIRIASDKIRVGPGSMAFDVQDASGLSVNDEIIVLRTPNQAWIDRIGMGDLGDGAVPWTAERMTTAHPRKVISKRGNRIGIDMPLFEPIDRRWGGGEVYKTSTAHMIQNVGIEGLYLISTPRSETDEGHTNNAITFSQVKNGWVRRVTAKYFWYSAVRLRNASSFNTVEDVGHITPKSEVAGGRRYSFNVVGGAGPGNLFQRCYASQSRHAFVTGRKVVGPQVWLDSLSDQALSEDGPHQMWATGLLYDNTEGLRIKAENQRRPGSDHGWTGAQVMFWNITYPTYVLFAPSTMMNWAVGVTGQRGVGRFNEREVVGIDQVRTGSKPRSLYLHQLQDRLGQDKMMSITTQSQRQGRALEVLRSLASGNGPFNSEANDPTCARGRMDASRAFCCPASCGTCGGASCDSRPGGAACCAGSIESSQRRCLNKAAPCKL